MSYKGGFVSVAFAWPVSSVSGYHKPPWLIRHMTFHARLPCRHQKRAGDISADKYRRIALVQLAMGDCSNLTVLVTGGSGYLGQFLVHGLTTQHKVVYTYSSRPLINLPEGVLGAQVDFATGQGLSELFHQHGPFHVVINCVAISQPALCEKEPQVARSVNVPDHLLKALTNQQQEHQVTALLIHLSTDQVYDGSRAMWCERDVCEPVNQYGRTKLQAEQAIQAAWPHSVVLRSSLIYGPPAPDPVPRPLFIQFVDGVVVRREPTSFFLDEWRCPVYVKDIVCVVQTLMAKYGSPANSPSECLVFNMGGPERLSRVDIAHKVAAYRGLSEQEVAAVVLPVPSASVARGVVSPADISMCSDLLSQHLGIKLTPLSEALTEFLGA